MFKRYLSVLALLLFAVSASVTPSMADTLRTQMLSVSYGSKKLNVRIGIKNPTGPIQGDILYIHGFGDRLDNHAPLFEAWNRAGMRVIAFDLPSHGEDSGNYNDLNNFGFADLAVLAAKVEDETKPVDSDRPLILSGWSTGGLLVTRMLQTSLGANFSRPVKGAILFAPGVSVRKFPWTFGNRLGEVTEATLTHNPHPPHVSKIQPDSPFWNRLIFDFTPKLLLNSILSQWEIFPTDIPTLVFSGGESEDMYAKSEVVRAWVDQQNTVRRGDSRDEIVSIFCPHSMHEMDNELAEFGGTEVRETAAAFALEIVSGTTHGTRPSVRVCSQL